MSSDADSPAPAVETTPAGLKIGVVGFGPFAQFLTKTILKHHPQHSITATSRSDYSHLSSQLGIPFFRDLDSFCDEDHDVILLCPSILSFSHVVCSIPFHRFPKPPLVVDVLSVKEYPKDLLLHVLPEECDVVCTHPMFGPESGKDGWNNLPLVYDKVRIRDQNICSNFLGIFEKEGCRMVEMSCREHDMFAARSQFLSHTVGRTLSEMGIDSTPLDTKAFNTLLQLKDNTMKDSYDLYCGLFKHNKYARKELENMDAAFQRLKKKLLEEATDEQLEDRPAMH